MYARGGLLLAIVALAFAGCSVEEPDNSGKYIGLSEEALVMSLGKPTLSYPLTETSGKIIVYAPLHQTHYVFETGPDGIVHWAATVSNPGNPPPRVY